MRLFVSVGLSAINGCSRPTNFSAKVAMKLFSLRFKFRSTASQFLPDGRQVQGNGAAAAFLKTEG
jgi:hypothetical protein